MATKSTKNPKGVKRMEEPVKGAKMPSGEIEEGSLAGESAAFESAATEGSMPAPGMGEGAAAEAEMPAGSMGEPEAISTEMPSGGMAEPAATAADMPKGGMGEGEAGAGADRFPPSDLPFGTAPPATFEPGVVEVEFREGVKPQINPAKEGAPCAISSPADVNLNEFNKTRRSDRLPCHGEPPGMVQQLRIPDRRLRSGRQCS
jgi:hypothetical protein